MNIDVLITRVLENKKQVDKALQNIRRISSLDADRPLNFPKIETEVSNLQKLVQPIAANQTVYADILSWVNEYRAELDDFKVQYKREFGLRLSNELEHIGLKLSGNFPLLRAGLYTFELNHTTWSVKIWYGSKKEALHRCSFSTDQVATRVIELQNNLGSMLPEMEFAELLHHVYLETIRGETENRVPIIKLYKAVAAAIKKDSLQASSMYGRADFSYDLYRTRNHSSHPDLITATKAYTKYREDFLWVPSDENGSGATYSHITYSKRMADG